MKYEESKIEQYAHNLYENARDVEKLSGAFVLGAKAAFDNPELFKSSLEETIEILKSMATHLHNDSHHGYAIALNNTIELLER